MKYLTVNEILMQFVRDPNARKAEFFRYYSNKRIQHQLMQLEMLKDVPALNLTEIGSYLGFATALFLAAGFNVQTIDECPEGILGKIVSNKHISKNITDITSEDLNGQDIIVCCETLEHLPYLEVEKTLQVFYESQTEWLLISVPYRCFSIDIRLIKNPFTAFFNWIVKLPTKKFVDFEPHPEPSGHKWELGYKGYPIDKLKNSIEKTGFCVKRTGYVGTVQSVFILAQRSTTKA
jgi:hypothetical protein